MASMGDSGSMLLQPMQDLVRGKNGAFIRVFLVSIIILDRFYWSHFLGKYNISILCVGLSNNDKPQTVESRDDLDGFDGSSVQSTKNASFEVMSQNEKPPKLCGKQRSTV